MLGRIGARFGLILVMALTVRGVAFFFGPTHPRPPRTIPHATAGIPDGPAPTDPEMRRAIARVKAAGWGTRGAQLTYGYGADAVTVTPDQLAAARAMVRRDRETLDRQLARVMDEEAQDARPGAVSFEPGQPMVDPNPEPVD